MIFSFAPDFCLVVKAEGEGELQGGQSSIVNGSFENPPNYRLEDLAQALGSQKGYKEKTPQNEIPGWNTTSTEGAIELGWLKGNGTSPHMVPTVKTEIISGTGASDGWQFAETIGNERHPGSLRQSDVFSDRYINSKRTIARKIIMNSVHLAYFMSADIHGGLLLQPMEVVVCTVEGIGRREDIDAFEEIKTKEQQEKTNGSQNANLYFPCVFHTKVN